MQEMFNVNMTDSWLVHRVLIATTRNPGTLRNDQVYNFAFQKDTLAKDRKKVGDVSRFIYD